LPIEALQDAPLWLNGLIFLGAAVVVWMAGTRLTHALDAIANKTGLGEAFVGMLLLGGITSLPEVANVLTASAGGVPALAVNNLLGSAAINILLLALVDAVIGREALTSVVAAPATMMMGALCMLVLALVAVAVTVGDVAVLGVGLWSVAIFLVSIGSFAIAASYGKRAPWVLKEGQAVVDGRDEPASEASVSRLALVASVTAVLIFAAGYTLSEVGDVLAERSGLGAGFVGFMLIGLATSMPELSSITTALRIRRYEMAFGQVLGTNFVNLSLFLLADVAYRGGPVVSELGNFEVLSALLGLILVGIFLVGLLERRDRVILRAGYDSAAVILLFLGGVGLLYAIR
jgi:cation:H+ antiporter